MGAKEFNDIERMEGLLTDWQVLAGQARVAAAAPPVATDESALPPFDIRWAAGLFDGEGCIHIAQQWKGPGTLPTHHLRATITQNDLTVLEHFQRGMGVGGHIYEVPARPGHCRTVYTLNYATADTIALLQRLGPYLVRKRAEFALAQRFWLEGAPGACHGPRGMSPEVRAVREYLYREMKRVKRAPIGTSLQRLSSRPATALHEGDCAESMEDTQ